MFFREKCLPKDNVTTFKIKSVSFSSWFFIDKNHKHEICLFSKNVWKRLEKFPEKSILAALSVVVNSGASCLRRRVVLPAVLLLIQLTDFVSAIAALAPAELRLNQLEHHAKDAIKMADPMLGNKNVKPKF